MTIRRGVNGNATSDPRTGLELLSPLTTGEHSRPGQSTSKPTTYDSAFSSCAATRTTGAVRRAPAGGAAGAGVRGWGCGRAARPGAQGRGGEGPAGGT